MTKSGPKQRAFTLIEMLVVITIIGIIASMVLGLAGMAARKKKDVVANAVINRLVLMIENYHSKLGFYPPDNAANITATPATYDQTTSTNQLLYELTGCTYLGGTQYQAIDGTTLPVSGMIAAYGRGGIANSNPDQPHNFYYPPPKPADYALYPVPPAPGVVLNGLIVPIQSGPSTTGPNYVHYDSSSTNRHNMASYDVWVEYWAGTDKSGNTIIVTNGNW